MKSSRSRDGALPDDLSSDIAVAGSGASRVNLRHAGPAFERPNPELLDAFSAVSSATAAGTLHKLGVTRAYINGPRSLNPGAKVVGSALTLAFMPRREDVAAAEGQEYFEKDTALWAVLEEARPFDVLVVQAFGDPFTGCFGEMLVKYFRSRGGTGIVVDGCVRDWPRLEKMGLPIWAVGVTPHFASQGGLLPWSYNVPVACGGALVLPGDVVVADADGAVVVPAQIAAHTARVASAHEEWEVFSRQRLEEGGRLSKYYPLDDEASLEYERWKSERP